MKKEKILLRHMAAWMAILALPLAYANIGLALIAIDCDLSAFEDIIHGFELMAAKANGSQLIRWSMIADMLGFYLMLVPLALVLWSCLKAKDEKLISLSTVFGLGYLLSGAMGAGILSVVVPQQLTAYVQGSVGEQEMHQAVFLALSDRVYNGVWGTLDPILVGVWWVGVGSVLRKERRRPGWAMIVVGTFILLRNVKVGPMEFIGLSVHFFLAPLLAAWLGIELLRGMGGARQKGKRARGQYRSPSASEVGVDDSLVAWFSCQTTCRPTCTWSLLPGLILPFPYPAGVSGGIGLKYGVQVRDKL